MTLNTIDAKLLQKMFLAGAKSIEVKKEYINELNVFPVPDGDTGTNMTLTIMSAAKEVSTLTNPTIEDLCKAISSGSLRGARGNSGVILSQLFRGLTKEFKEHKQINVTVMANAFQKAVETAYKAVMKPKEGTILTVARGGAERAAELVNETTDLVYFGAEVIKRMEEVLAHTPELLPVLKEAGVVESGGQGLLEIVKGAYDAMLGKNVDFTIAPATTSTPSATKKIDVENIATADIKFGYCTEFIIMLEKDYNEKKEHEFKGFLESIGDSIVVVSDDDIVKVHVHTNHPGQAFEKALEYGQLTKMKVDNMREEHNQKVVAQSELQAAAAKQAMEKNSEAEQKKAEPAKDFGFITIAPGSGIAEIFKGLGVDEVIEGGQTMNPSTEDIVNSINKVNAEVVYVLPNNKNIIMAAELAVDLVEDKKVIVIGTKTIPQGITAITMFNHDGTAEENVETMKEVIENVTSGEVTYAVKDSEDNGRSIKEGDILGIKEGKISKISNIGNEVYKVCKDLIASMVNEDSELITIFYGEDCEEEKVDELVGE